jgi:hypothetical protein
MTLATDLCHRFATARLTNSWDHFPDISGLAGLIRPQVRSITTPLAASVEQTQSRRRHPVFSSDIHDFQSLREALDRVASRGRSVFVGDVPLIAEVGVGLRDETVVDS